MITRDAIIAISTIIRILPGIWFRMRLTDRLENATTNMTAILITKAVSIFVVTASAEQMPSICTPIGLFSNIGLDKVFLYLPMQFPFEPL
jgi:hypothetical protein